MKKEMAEKFLPESWETSAILLKLLKAPLTALHEIEKIKENGETFLRRELWTVDDLLLIESCFRNRTQMVPRMFSLLVWLFLKAFDICSQNVSGIHLREQEICLRFNQNRSPVDSIETFASWGRSVSRLAEQAVACHFYGFVKNFN